MTRTDTTNVARSEEKNDGSPSNRKPWDKKKTTNINVWPCTIDGCNKEFAREADLRRHQRTTKLHSMPGFSCPRCHANFTRTDALRRHQKSRHSTTDGSSSSSPVSPTYIDATRKGKCKEGTPSSPSVSESSTAGAKKHYRDDTAGFTPTYTLYPATTSKHPGWTYPAHWPSDNPHYTPSPYYRSSYIRNGPSLPPLSCSNSDSSFSESPRSTPISPTNPPESTRVMRIPLDPPISAEAVPATPEEVEVVMKAVMRYAEVDSASRRTGEGSQEHEGESIHTTRHRDDHDDDDNDDVDDRDGSLPLEDLLHHYDSPVHRPGSLQDILTDDCEPLFHPVDLLVSDTHDNASHLN